MKQIKRLRGILNKGSKMIIHAKSKYSILLIILLILFAFLPAVSFADASKIFKENNKSVVAVIVYDENGNVFSECSGFIVKSGLGSNMGAVVATSKTSDIKPICTNPKDSEDLFHKKCDCNYLNVITDYDMIVSALRKFGANFEDFIKVKAGDKVFDIESWGHQRGLYENDFVNLKVKDKNMPVVKLGNIDKENIGEKVYVMSCSSGIERTITDGILSGIREIEPEKKMLQITAPIQSGSSGGPVFNENGEVIGIAKYILDGEQNLNLAVPVNPIRDIFINRFSYWEILGLSLNNFISTHPKSMKSLPDEALEMKKSVINAFEQTIRINPGNTKIYGRLGYSYLEAGRHKDAIEICQQAIRFNPDDDYIHGVLGEIYISLSKYNEAIDECKQAIKMNPDNDLAFCYLGTAYFRLSRYKEAIEAFKQAIRIDPDYLTAHFNLGYTYLLLDDRGSALGEYKMLKSLDSEKADELFNEIYK